MLGQIIEQNTYTLQWVFKKLSPNIETNNPHVLVKVIVYSSTAVFTEKILSTMTKRVFVYMKEVSTL